MFVRIGNYGFNPSNIVDIIFLNDRARIYFKTLDGDGNQLRHTFHGADYGKFMAWFNENSTGDRE